MSPDPLLAGGGWARDYRVPASKRSMLASFPGLPRLQFLIACGMQLQAIKNWSRGRPGNEARVCSTSGEKRTSKHGISMVLKLVIIEYQKRGAILAAL